jgi:Rrf2 family protein
MKLTAHRRADRIVRPYGERNEKMQLSTRARYATRAMIELTFHYGKGPLQLREIAKKQGISEKYLEQVLTFLRKEGFILTQKGNRGGYLLAMPPGEITLYDVIRSVEGSLLQSPVWTIPLLAKKLRDV